MRTATATGAASSARTVQGARRPRRSLILILAGLVGLCGSPEPARADAAGPACVENGRLLYLNGHRAYGRCHGGDPVLLYGIDAPDVKQTCTREGESWPCGRHAASMLLRLTLNRTVRCMGNSRDREGRLIGVCHVDGMEVNRMMVQLGFAVTTGTRYTQDQDEARAARRGLWAGPFDHPADWRAAR
ncbi:thermonuclease family protein [Roseospira visakhapatnamensis]|uniref:Endonuclease YncB(Thermonuclease family) n=1 Tax=Roseospira visakhapatnamensis TaxID=390880 RepID=A0A7W6RBH8_9PROT|nr:thermonuclease family protein [Roseospira visakhapatnamensis]MBB4265481.1 endonuclease YncB(thermonuclease family) [Roseospira visakhapatnamensis]